MIGRAERDLGVEVPLRVVFEATTARALAAELDTLVLLALDPAELLAALEATDHADGGPR